MTEPFGPRAHPERCDEWPVDSHGVPVDRHGDAGVYDQSGMMADEEGECADWRLTVLCILQAIQTVALVGGAYLFFRWARIAC